MNKWLWIISTQIPAGALVLKVHEILEKNKKKKKQLKIIISQTLFLRLILHQ